MRNPTVVQVHGLELPKRVFPCATPAEVREMLPAGKDVVAFQCRNPIHRAHYELFTRALHAGNVGDGAVCLVHPTCGPTQGDDIPGIVRYHTYEVLKKEVDNPAIRWAYLPYSMHMAGPREAIQHMLIRKNYGCTHFIIGRDMAGSKSSVSGEDFYGAYDAQVPPHPHPSRLNSPPLCRLCDRGVGAARVPRGDAVAVPCQRFRPALARRTAGPRWHMRACAQCTCAYSCTLASGGVHRLWRSGAGASCRAQLVAAPGNPRPQRVCVAAMRLWSVVECGCHSTTHQRCSRGVLGRSRAGGQGQPWLGVRVGCLRREESACGAVQDMVHAVLMVRAVPCRIWPRTTRRSSACRRCRP